MAQRRRSVARPSHRLAWLAGFALAALLAAGPAAARGSGNARPVIAVVADNAGTEVTDFLVPYGVLSDSGAADVIAVSTRPGPVVLMPSNLLIQAERTLESFDQEHPEGADYVVVPALHERDQPEVVAWLRAQGEKGATLFAICDGAWTLAATGRLDGRMATTHWYSRSDIAEKYPNTQWRDDRRYIHDRDVITTTGVSASIPASLYVVQLLAGPERAAALAKELGLASFGDAHDGAAFALTAGRVATAAINYLAFWRWERIGVEVEPRVDEVALALSMDVLSRTFRTSAVVVAKRRDPVRTRFGLMLEVQERSDAPDLAWVVPAAPEGAPAGQTLDRLLGEIQTRYGEATADFAALQLEYAR